MYTQNMNGYSWFDMKLIALVFHIMRKSITAIERKRAIKLKLDP